MVIKEDKLQLKIKIEMVPELPVSVPHTEVSLDWSKIIKFIFFLVCITLIIIYFLWPSSPSALTPAPSLPSPLPQSPLPRSDVLVKADIVSAPVVEKVLTVAPIMTVSNVEHATVPVEQPQLTSTPPVSTLGSHFPVVQSKIVAVEEFVHDIQAAPNLPIAVEPIKDLPSPLNLKVQRAMLTSAIDQREPVNTLGNVVSLEKHRRIYFFTHLVDSNKQQMEHRWFYKNQLQAAVVLKIGSDNWRTYSSKGLTENMLGAWRVELVDQSNTLLNVINFDISH